MADQTLAIYVNELRILTMLRMEGQSTRADTARRLRLTPATITRLRGGGPIQGSFPPDAQRMTIANRQDLQRRLTAAEFDTEGADGAIGAKTRAAISAYQARVGLVVTGKPPLDLLANLR